MMGLIPARAGKTSRECALWKWSWAHPRACGENLESISVDALNEGSSPRVRGKQLAQLVEAHARRLIPARAGKTRAKDQSVLRPRAHPRACGENQPRDREFTHPLGSSPRVRGKQCGHQVVGGGERLIPARAGKTCAICVVSRSRTAHPRACGENGLVHDLELEVRGSSPRVRGKRDHERRRVRARGLIPARAGKTSSSHMGASSASAHPRACGENAS
ncbi:hypothetical protein HMPREF9005_1191 [Actinomyces sp. oral taxon 178 str. F0338]|nr:hypothetical protein HMPREF9005_1191 [Actinomyces sp. oral taxon 178 str. F0338]